MTSGTLFVLTLLSALGCGLMAGICYAFSTFVMKGLTRLPPTQGIAAMQSINIAVINPWFMAMFLGTAVGCLALLGYSLLAWQSPRSYCLLGASLLYLVGTVLVTIVGNVPLNNALAATNPLSAESAQRWASFLASWINWNHIRTATALAATVLFILALWLPSANETN